MADRSPRLETTEDEHASRQVTSVDVTSGSGAREKDRTWRQRQDSDSSNENQNLLHISDSPQFDQRTQDDQRFEPYLFGAEEGAYGSGSHEDHTYYLPCGAEHTELQNEEHKRRLRQDYVDTPSTSQAAASPIHREQAEQWFGQMQAEGGMSVEDAQLFMAAVTGQSPPEIWANPPEEAGQSSVGPTTRDPPSDPLGSNAISSVFSTLYDANEHEPNLATGDDVYMKPQNAGRPVRTFSLGKRQASEEIEHLGDGTVGQVKRSCDNFFSMMGMEEDNDDDTENQDVNVGPSREIPEAGVLGIPRKRKFPGNDADG